MATGSSDLRVRIVHRGSNTSISVAGELDLANKAVLRSHLDYVTTAAAGDLELDLGDVVYIDSTGLAEILAASAAVVDQGRQLRVTKASRQVTRLFEICGVTDLLDAAATSAAS